jgi:hypothetical protein
VVRVNQYFQMLIGADVDPDDGGQGSVSNIIVDPDLVGGTIGSLRDEMGLRATKSGNMLSYVNNVDDEKVVTDVRVIVEYVLAILNSWINSVRFFMTMETPFLGTQLVWIQRQLGVVNEAVDEVRFLMDSVFVGPAERETLWLTNLADKEGRALPVITLEALLSWIQAFVTSEGPDMIQSGGRLAIGEDFQRMVRQLHRYAHALVEFAEESHAAFGTERIVFALQKLMRQLHRLHQMARSVGIIAPPDLADSASQSPAPTASAASPTPSAASPTPSPSSPTPSPTAVSLAKQNNKKRPSAQ